MNYEMKAINKTIVFSWLLIIGVLTTAYAIQVIRHERTLGYYLVFLLILFVPWIMVYIVYRRKKDWNKLGYLIILGYSVMYMFVMITGSTQMVTNYILPLLCILILYHDTILIVYSFLLAFLINYFTLVYEYHNGYIISENIKEIEIRFATIVLCFIGGYISARLYDKVYNERVRVSVAALKAEAANDAKGAFLAHMSHEIRTPINAVLGMDTMILRETKEPAIKQYAMDIQKAGSTLLSLVNDILDISKIESGKMELVNVNYDFSSLVHDTVSLIREKASDKELELKVNVDSEIPCTLHGDDVRIRQVLVNILSNAVKYTDEGTVTLSISGHKEGNIEKLHFSVKDTGIGIKEENLHKLFEEFERIEELRNRHIEGTGLGMSITINLLSMMGTTLEVKSEYGVGSEFYFDLEQEIIRDERIGDITSRISQMTEEYSYEVLFTAPDAKILVVDDNKTNLSVVRDLLKETQIDVHTTVSGLEALEMIRDTKYDVILLDHMMPDMDGIEVMNRITGDPTHLNVGTPVIVLTANAIEGAREEYISAGFNDYLSKPIIPDKLERMLAKYISEDKVVYGPAIPVKKEEPEEQIELPMIEGIDWNYAKLHFGKVDSIVETVKSLYSTIDLDCEELEGYYNQIISDNAAALDSYRIKIHSIKSTATLLGILPIAGMAATLEYAARDGKVDKVIEMAPHFITDFKIYKSKLGVAFELESAVEKQEIVDKDDVISIIRELNDQISVFDVHGADASLEKIKSYQYNDNGDKIISKLSGAVTNLDTDLVSKLCDELIEEVVGL